MMSAYESSPIPSLKRSPYEMFQGNSLILEEEPYQFTQSLKSSNNNTFSTKNTNQYNLNLQRTRSLTYAPSTPSGSVLSPHSQRSVSSSKREKNLSFGGIGQTIMRKTDIIVSNKKLFSNSGGLGPVRVGSDEWMKAKEKHERVQSYIMKPGGIPAQPIFMSFQSQM